MRKILFVVLFSAVSLAHAASSFVFSNEPGQHAVGLRIVKQYDYSRTYKSKIDVLTGQPALASERGPCKR